MEIAEPVRRTSEIEEFTNLHFIHPIASRLTPLFAAMHISPNAVSLTGMLFGISAAFSYYHYLDLPYAIAGFVLMIAWHVMDGADGQLARLTHSQSELGKILDGICDYVTFIAVYVALAIVLSRQYGDWMWALVVAAGGCHAAQAAAYEAQRQEYNFWGHGRTSMKLPDLDMAPPDTASMSPPQRLMNFLYRQYVWLQLTVSGINPTFYTRLSALLEAEPERDAAIRRRYRDVFAPVLRRWSVLSANYRTLGIFVGTLFRAPQVYFWFEIVGFSAILIALLSRQQARYASFLDGLDAQG